MRCRGPTVATAIIIPLKQKRLNLVQPLKRKWIRSSLMASGLQVFDFEFFFAFFFAMTCTPRWPLTVNEQWL
jgi:hypothetical protein